MDDLFYTPLEIAAIISTLDFGCKKESKMIDEIWEGEQQWICPDYRSSKRQFILKVRYWLYYFLDKPVLDKEFPSIQKDMESRNMTLPKEQYVSDLQNLDLFFKNIRIKILYGEGKKYVRMKLRTLLRHYGYKRRTQSLVERIETCIEFYQLMIATRGYEQCRIQDVKLDQMITFRVYET